MLILHSFQELAHVRSAFEPQADKVNTERLAPQVPAAHARAGMQRPARKGNSAASAGVRTVGSNPATGATTFQPGEDEMPEPVTVDQVENGLLTEYRTLSRCAREADQWQLAEVIQDSAKKAAGIVDAIIKSKAAAEARAISAAIHAQRAEMGLPDLSGNGSDEQPKRRVGRPPNSPANGEEKGNSLYPQT